MKFSHFLKKNITKGFQNKYLKYMLIIIKDITCKQYDTSITPSTLYSQTETFANVLF